MASESAAFYRGIRASIAWLHQRAREMSDPHARAVLNSAAFNLGTEKPEPFAARSESLTAMEERVRRLEAALQPFAAVSDDYGEDLDGGRIGDAFPGSEVMYGRDAPNLGHFRKAKAALTKDTPNG